MLDILVSDDPTSNPPKYQSLRTAIHLPGNSQLELVQVASFDRFVMKKAVRRHALARWTSFYVIGWAAWGHVSSSADVVRVQGERF